MLIDCSAKGLECTDFSTSIMLVDCFAKGLECTDFSISILRQSSSRYHILLNISQNGIVNWMISYADIVFFLNCSCRFQHQSCEIWTFFSKVRTYILF
jgi:hypothetical protein